MSGREHHWVWGLPDWGNPQIQFGTVPKSKAVGNGLRDNLTDLLVLGLTYGWIRPTLSEIVNTHLYLMP